MQIVEICDADKAKVSDYLTELLDEDKILLKPKRKQGIDKYALTEKGKDTTIRLLEKQKIKKQIDQMSTEKFQEFKKFIDFMMKSKVGEEFLLQFQDSGNQRKMKKFKNLGTTILPQD